MKYLLFAFLAPAMILGNRFVASRIPDLFTCLVVCGVFSLLVCSVVAALILNGGKRRPVDPSHRASNSAFHHR